MFSVSRFFGRPMVLTGLMGLCACPSLTRGDTSYVRLQSDNPNVVLKRVTGDVSASAWGYGGVTNARAMSSETVCSAPCEQHLDRNAEYYIDGTGIHTSKRFILPSGAALLKVKAGSALGWGLGVISFSVGGGLIAGGATLVGLGYDDSYLLKAGLGMLIPGILLTIPGAVLMGVNRTHVITESGLELAAWPTQKRVRLTRAGLSPLASGVELTASFEY